MCVGGCTLVCVWGVWMCMRVCPVLVMCGRVAWGCVSVWMCVCVDGCGWAWVCGCAGMCGCLEACGRVFVGCECVVCVGWFWLCVRARVCHTHTRKSD